MRQKLRTTNGNNESSFDLSISDLMAALLLIFILLLSATLLNLKEEFEEKNSIAEKYYQLQVSLYNDLFNEFKDDLDEWGAEIDKDTLAIRFKEPDVLFEPNKSILRSKFKTILEDFMPRYIKILRLPKYLDNIDEILIEGHTANPGNIYDYMDGVILSQSRTNNVLAYTISSIVLNEKNTWMDWFKSKITANGLSSSRPIKDVNGEVDWNLSRRVEFRVRTNAEEQIREILDIGIRYDN